MFPAQIDHYVRPRNVADALAAFSTHAEAMFLAGGQSAMQAIKARLLRPRTIIDLQDVAELRGINRERGGLRIGAMTRYADIARLRDLPAAFAALVDATRHVGDRQVRNRGTIGGSLCWNYAAACTPTVVLALDGKLELASASGASRVVSADDFLLGPLETARGEDEVLVAVSWPAPAARTGSAYRKWGLVTDALPVVGVCIQVTLDDHGACSAARVAITGTTNGAVRAPGSEAALIGSRTGDAALATALNVLAAEADTVDDLSATAAYRKQLLVSVGREVAASAFARAAGESVA
jgi:carbon-monoxide dehydrogenase medium subunit